MTPEMHTAQFKIEALYDKIAAQDEVIALLRTQLLAAQADDYSQYIEETTAEMSKEAQHFFTPFLDLRDILKSVHYSQPVDTLRGKCLDVLKHMPVQTHQDYFFWLLTR
jgi:hypothetical protein